MRAPPMVDDDPELRPPADPPLTRAAPLLWGLAGLVLAAVVAVFILRYERGPRPRFLTEPPPTASPAPLVPAPADGSLGLAGSGSNLPLTRMLVESFRRRAGAGPRPRIIVHESIGSGGGVRALRDGAVSVALVSRPLGADEARLGLRVWPYARVAVVVAANPTVPDACTTRDEVVAMYAGTRARWSDGSRVVVLQRERGDSSLLAFGSLVPALLERNEAAYREGRWRVLYHDRAMQEALMATEGAVGIFDLGAIEAQQLPIKVLCVDGVTPSRDTLLTGQYAVFKDLSMVTLDPPPPLAAELIRFVLSPIGRALTERLGYLPLPLAEGGKSP